MKDIIWKDIEGFEGYYAVSNTGLVESYHRGKHQMCPCRDKDGYLHVTLSLCGKVSRRSVHRLVASAFLENTSNLPMVNHKDRIIENNNLSNLEWVTVYENTMHGYRNNGQIKGLTVLPLDVIASIPAMYNSGSSYIEIINSLDAICTPKDIGALLSGRKFSESTGIKSDIRRLEDIPIVTKATDAMVLDIYRRYYKLKESQKSLCALYSLSPAQVSRIINGSRRRDLYEAYFLTQASS